MVNPAGRSSIGNVPSGLAINTVISSTGISDRNVLKTRSRFRSCLVASIEVVAVSICSISSMLSAISLA